MRVTYGDIPPSVEVDPDTRGRYNPCARARTIVLALLFVRREAPICMHKAPLGMLVTYTHITPRDDCPTRKVMLHFITTILAASGRPPNPTQGASSLEHFLPRWRR